MAVAATAVAVELKGAKHPARRPGRLFAQRLRKTQRSPKRLQALASNPLIEKQRQATNHCVYPKCAFIIVNNEAVIPEPDVGQPEASTLAALLEQHGERLWRPSKHRTNVYSFVLEANEILLGRPLRSFELEHLETIQATLRQRGNSAATINRKTMALSKLLRAAHKAGRLRGVPEFRQLKEPPERIRFLSSREESSLFDHILSVSKGYCGLSIVLVDTGAKIGEVIGLTWADIPLDGTEIRLSHNNKYERTIPTTTRVASILKRMERKNTGPFCSIEQYKYRAVWNEAKVLAGLGNDDGVVPYVLRHTCASRLVQGGVDLRRVQLWLGHRTLKMTMRYDYLSTNDLSICVDVLQRLPGPRLEHS